MEERRIWKIQHNVLHHTFTNVDGLDEDIDMHPFMHFGPLKPATGGTASNIFLGFYVDDPLLDDGQGLASVAPLPQENLIKPSGTTVAKLAGSLAFTKVGYFSYALVLPMLFNAPTGPRSCSDGA